MRRMWVLAAAMLAMQVAPAAAADVATLGCASSEMSEPDRELFRDMARRIGRGEQVSQTDKTRAILLKASTACQKRYGWTDAARDASSTYTMSALGIAGIEVDLARQGIKLADVVDSYRALSPADRAGLTQLSDASLDKLFAQFASRGIPLDSAERAKMLGALVSLIAHRDESEAKFAAS